MEKILVHELVAAVQGTLLTADGAENGREELSAAQAGHGESGACEITSVVTDSRRISPGCVFFALCGERFDGHAFVDSALDQGAAACVVSRRPEVLRPGKYYVLVEDTLRALGGLAAWYRSRFDVKVIGITGSVGKTTCREMVAAVLSGRFRVHSTRGNFNNEIGLPMTILSLSREDEVMVLEMGMNHPGEIGRLTRIAAPDIGVITNIGTAHIGILGSRENIFRAKKEIFEGMPEGAAAVLCGDDDYLPRIAEDPVLSSRYRILYAGTGTNCAYRGSHVRLEVGGIEAGQTGTSDKGREKLSLVTRCRISMPAVSADLDLVIHAAGLHLVEPASIAVAVADLLGMTREEILRGLETFSGQRMRCEKYGDVLLFDDTYNASPESMESSLRIIAALPASRRVAVLGDMLEQGEYAEELHRRVGAAAAKAGIDTLIAVGKLSRYMAEEAAKEGLADVRACEDRQSAAGAVEEATKPGTVILFKASHGMALGKLAEVSRAKAKAAGL